MQAVLAQSFLDFLQTTGQKGCKISKWLSSGNDYVNRKLLAVGNYYSFREASGLVSYCPAGREQQLNDNGAWKREGRDVIKPGKLLKKLFPFNVTDQDIEQFVGRFKAAERLGDFHLATTAREINRIYEDFIDTESCMRGEEVGQFYAKLGAKLLYLMDDDTIIGRAIVWKVTEPDITFMDRVYSKTGEEDWIEQKFFAYAREMGWCRKARQNRECDVSTIFPDGEYKNLEMKIEGDTQVDFYPYLDTFKSGDDSTLYNSYGNGYYSYEFTNGDREDEDEHEHEVQLENGDWVDEDEAVNINGEWYHIDDCVICHRNNVYILESDAYRIDLSRNETIYIHERYVTQC